MTDYLVSHEMHHQRWYLAVEADAAIAELEDELAAARHEVRRQGDLLDGPGIDMRQLADDLGDARAEARELKWMLDTMAQEWWRSELEGRTTPEELKAAYAARYEAGHDA